MIFSEIMTSVVPSNLNTSENRAFKIYVTAASEFIIFSCAVSERILILNTSGLSILSVGLLYQKNAQYKILMVCISMKNFAFP